MESDDSLDDQTTVRKRYKNYFNRDVPHAKVPKSTKLKYNRIKRLNREKEREAQLIERNHNVSSERIAGPTVKLDTVQPNLVEPRDHEVTTVSEQTQADPFVTQFSVGGIAQQVTPAHATFECATVQEGLEGNLATTNQGPYILNPGDLEALTGHSERPTDNESDTDKDIHPRNILPSSSDESENSSLEENTEDLSSVFKHYLNQKILSEKSDVPVAVTRGEIILMAFKFSLLNNSPLSTVKSLLHFINAIFVEPILPDTRFLIDKLLTIPFDDVTFHFQCHECTAIVNFSSKNSNNKEAIVCGTCQTSYTNRSVLNSECFITWDISQELKDLIEKNAEFYNFVVRVRQRQDGTFSDIFDGKEYRDFVKSLKEEDRQSYATLMANSDGSPLYKSSSFSLWPCQLIYNEMPIQERQKNNLTCGLWFGRNKPDMNIFLRPIVDRLNELSEEGVECKILDETIKIRPYVICCCVDSQARPPMQGLIAFNGYSGCNWCLHPGEYWEPSKAMKYPIRESIPDLRTEEQSARDIDQACAEGVIVNGFKCYSPMNDLKKFKIIKGFTPDYMHNVLLGISKQFGNYWFKDRKQDYSISKANIKKVDNILKKLRPHTQIGRLSRPITYRNYWKAREWENFLLHFSIPIMSAFLKKKYFDHWQKLIAALFILLKSTITKDELIEGNILLHEFVYETQKLYGEKAMTYNVHQLLHFAECVLAWGPLWAHCGFPFENGNGQLLKAVHAANGIGHQIVRQLRFKNTCKVILRDHATSKKTLNCLEKFGKRKTVKTFKVNSTRYIGAHYVPRSDLVRDLGMSLKHTVVYDKIIKDNVSYQSDYRKNLRSDNSYALLSNGTFVQCCKFVVDRCNKTEKLIAKIVETTKVFNDAVAIREIVGVDDHTIVVDTNEIVAPCNLVDVLNVSYLSPVPNKIHF